MKRIVQLTKNIARISYTLGSISLTLGIILSFVHTPASASPGVASDLNQVIINQPDTCDLAFKCEAPGCVPDDDYTYYAGAGNIICGIAIKASTNYFYFSSDGCVDTSSPPIGGEDDYCVEGIGTDTGRAWRLCEEDGKADCHAISHSEFYVEENPPTSTPTKTSSPTPKPTKTSTPTSTDTNTPTPTDTSTPTPTDTSTPTPTETNTPTPTDTSEPSPTPTDTSEPSPTPTGTIVTPTDTPPVDTATPTSTALGTVITPTTTQPVSDTPTPTATDPGEEATPTATDTSQPTLPPPQITGTPPSFLIPVTGVDLSSPFAQVEQLQLRLINIGLALLGLGLIFQGIGKKIEINS